MAKPERRKSSKASAATSKAPAALRERFVFGDVTISTPAPSKRAFARNVESGRVALANARKVLQRPGVTLDLRPGVPRFYIDERTPELIVREVGGRRSLGTFVNGNFRVQR